MGHMFISNQLPLRHVFRLLNRVTTGPYNFSEKSGKMIGGVASNWDVKSFHPIAYESFPVLSDEAL